MIFNFSVIISKVVGHMSANEFKSIETIPLMNAEDEPILALPTISARYINYNMSVKKGGTLPDKMAKALKRVGKKELFSKSVIKKDVREQIHPSETGIDWPWPITDVSSHYIVEVDLDAIGYPDIAFRLGIGVRTCKRYYAQGMPVDIRNGNAVAVIKDCKRWMRENNKKPRPRKTLPFVINLPT
jgi:hypothetical protein